MTPPSTRKPSLPSWHRWWDRLSLYLPMVLMGLLALLSYWVLESVPPPEPPSPPLPVVHEPDYIMHRFSVSTFDAQGRLKQEVRGEQARHYPDNGSIEIDLPHLRSIAPDGRQTTASARRMLSNAAQTEHELSDDVQVVRDTHTTATGTTLPRLAFQGTQLQVLTRDQLILSQQPVEIQRNQDRIRADRLHYDSHNRVALLKGRVHAVIQPTQTQKP